MNIRWSNEYLCNLSFKMILGEFNDCIMVEQPTFRISSKKLLMEAKAIDAGQRVRLYISSPVLMYYFLRYCNVETRHHFTGKCINECKIKSNAKL